MAFFDYPDAGPGAGDGDAPFLAGASEEDWAALRAHAEVLHLPAGHLVIPQGAIDRALYIVVDGRLEVTARGRRGSERLLRVIAPGTVIGEVAFFDERPRSAAVRASEDVTLLRLSYESFEVLSSKEPALGRRLLLDIGRVLATRLRAVEDLAGGGRR